MVLAFDNPKVIVVTMGAHYTPPGQGRGGFRGGTGTITVYKSSDEGVTWSEVKPAGLPAVGSLAIAQHTNSQRMSSVGRGLVSRSDHGGANWSLTATSRSGAGGP